MTKTHNIAALSYVLGRHLDRISMLMCSAKDGYVDLSREVRFFVAIGRRRFLDKDREFKELWSHYSDPCPNNVVVQEWKLDRDLAILEVACAIYTHKGILMKSEVPWDTFPEGGEETDDVLEVAA